MNRPTLAVPGIITAALLVASPASAQVGTAADSYERYARLDELCDTRPAVGTCKVMVPLCDATPTAAEVLAAVADLSDPAGCVRGGAGAGIGAGARAVAGSAPISWVPVVTDFLVARARAELALFVKRRVADALCDHAQAAALLPQTCALMKGPDDLLVGIPGTLRGDLDDLPANLRALAVAQLPSLPLAARRVGCFAVAAWDTYPALRDEGPFGALQFLAAYSPPAPCDSDTALAELLTWAKALTPALQASTLSAHDAYVDPVALRATIRLAAAAAGIPHGKLDRIDRALPTITTLIAALRDARTKPLDRTSAVHAAERFAAILVALAEVADAPALRDALLAVADLATADYASGIHHLALVAQNLIPADANQVLGGLVRYAVLVSGLAAAESDAEVTAILEGAAAPVGSYREYRRGVAGFIGGMAGVAAGTERADAEYFGALAPFLPVGVEIGGPLGKRSSWNVMLSIADLGAVAATRLDDDDRDDAGTSGTAKTTADADLASVFAPGIFAGIGLGDSPFVLGVGAEYLPASREVFECPAGAVCTTTRREPVVRAMAFLAIDLPVFPLFR